jgi:ligand-binding sensor domain-containing protein
MIKLPNWINHFSIAFFFSLSLYSQTLPYYHYTKNDGLPSSNVLDLFQDKDSFIWFGTINGLSKFDGQHFINYSAKDGLNSNTITSLTEGKNGELFIGNYENGLNVFTNGKFQNYCDKINGENLSVVFLLKFQNKIYAYRNTGTIHVLDQNKSIGKHFYNIRTKPFIVNRLATQDNHKIIALTNHGVYDFTNETFEKIKIKGTEDINVNCISFMKNGEYVLGGDGIIYVVSNSQVIKKYLTVSRRNKSIYKIFVDKKENIWFSVIGEGLFLIRKGSDKITNLGKKMGLGDAQVNGIMEDAEGNIWVVTYGKGVYCLANLYITNYNESDGLSNNEVHAIAQDRTGKILAGTFNGVNVFENGKFVPLKNEFGKTLSNDIFSIKNSNNNIYVCWASKTGEREKHITYKGIDYWFLTYPSFNILENGLYTFGSWGNSITFQKEIHNNSNFFLCYLFGDSSNSNRVNAIAADKKNNIWVGSSMGLCRLNQEMDKSKKIYWNKSYFNKDPVLKNKINAIYINGNDVWIAGVSGLVKYNSSSDSFTSFTNKEDYDFSSSTCITADNKGRIWIGNMKGLFVIENNSIKYLSSQTGLASDEVLSLYYDHKNNFLYAGTGSGISAINLNEFDYINLSAPRVKMIRVKAGDSVYTNYSNLILKPEQHDLFIDFKALNYTSPAAVKYRYKLKDDGWVETKYDFLNLISLKNGSYDLQITAKSQNTNWSEPLILKFRIMPRFVETIWFNFIIVLSIIFFSVLILKWRLKQNVDKNKKQLELTERINELKHKALSAMMNPHFIFNSLNAVQYLVNIKKYEEANDYIAMMAKLMRKNLDTAGSGLILLSEEIYRLKLYLDLEQLRFHDNFTYKIHIGDDIDVDLVSIPNMIIQPFVENSLWHGILNSGIKGHITISFSFDKINIGSIISNSLIIKICDNGVGINSAAKNKNENYISKGIQIVEERLRLLSAKMEIPQPIAFEDLSNRDNNSHGTEVIIYLPEPLYKIS